MHYIQKHILKTLMYTKYARFRDMRPSKVDSNVYSYHLRALLKEDLVEKLEAGYRLSPKGLFYVDKVSMENLEPRIQPKIITMIIVQNEKDEILLFPKVKQPFINAWMLPFGKVHLDDETLLQAASREMQEKVGLTSEKLSHVGDCYIRASINQKLVWYVLAHVFVTKIKSIDVKDHNLKWLDKKQRSDLRLTPATEEVIDKALGANNFFFETFDVEW